ncbi:DUF4190 domain-containing protein [Pseudonocardia oroxyli]|uniref:DUF4190 domain-containing protein n=1 Tax=Pseudonocardia oroxyli TaxID=366584 RepID=UPI001C40AA49|nr:DUF4190 domain-containing protein [Pseudonocardia oroxyli]
MGESGTRSSPTPPTPTNQFAILSLVFAFVVAPLGIIFGVIARKQIRSHGGNGQGMATAGLVIGSILTGLGVLLVVVQIVALASLTSAVSSASRSGAYDVTATAAQVPATAPRTVAAQAPRAASRVAVPAEFHGTWTGTATHSGYRRSAVSIVVSPTGGDLSYRFTELSCTGTMRPSSASGSRLTVTETYVAGTGQTACPNGSTATLTLSSDGSVLSYTSRSGATAELTKATP